jgi:hypothetical protein
MGRLVSYFLIRISRGWVVLAAFAILMAFMIWVLPSQAARAEKPAGSSRSPDLSLFYTAEELYQMAEDYGEQGRQAYIRARFSFDLIWPLVYMFFLATGISWTFHKVFPPGSRWQQANLLPLGAALFDYLENSSTSLVMGRYPSQTVVVDTLAGFFTLIKWVLVAGSFLLLMGMAGVVFLRSLIKGSTHKDEPTIHAP